jgi:hypothetical protein
VIPNSKILNKLSVEEVSLVGLSNGLIIMSGKEFINSSLNEKYRNVMKLWDSNSLNEISTQETQYTYDYLTDISNDYFASTFVYTLNIWEVNELKIKIKTNRSYDFPPRIGPIQLLKNGDLACGKNEIIQIWDPIDLTLKKTFRSPTGLSNGVKGLALMSNGDLVSVGIDDALII